MFSSRQRHVFYIISILENLFTSSDSIVAHYHNSFPRNMEALISLGLEIPLIYLDELTLQTAAEYLCILQGETVPPNDKAIDRPILGLLHVGPPTNLIFVKKGLPYHISNYILAHEIGHFLADIFYIKQRWTLAMPNQTETIRQAFTWGNFNNWDWLELCSLVKGLPARPTTITGRGQLEQEETNERELMADLIAREILAPWILVVPIFHRTTSKEEFCQMLQEDYGMPRKVAGLYYLDLKQALSPRPSFTDLLFQKLLSIENENRNKL